MHELVLLVPADRIEAICDALLDEQGALSVWLEDADAASADEAPLYEEPQRPLAWTRSVASALFSDADAATRAATLLIAADVRIGLRSMRPVPDTDWVRLSQSQFEPIAITPRFWIVPTWHEAPPAAETVIRLDPGRAFGTGAHPTTRLCLRWIARHAHAWPRVLDYGCGSGILAIAAALHGALEVDAVDIDPAAVQATATNAAANGVRLNAGPPETARGDYALVVANVLAAPLEALAPVLAGHLAARGNLLLAGVLERQADRLRAAYAPHCALAIDDRDGGWILMRATCRR